MLKVTLGENASMPTLGSGQSAGFDLYSAEKITLERVYETLFRIAKLVGKGSQDLKMKYISSLLNDATPLEAKFVLKILKNSEKLVEWNMMGLFYPIKLQIPIIISQNNIAQHGLSKWI